MVNLVHKVLVKLIVQEGGHIVDVRSAMAEGSSSREVKVATQLVDRQCAVHAAALTRLCCRLFLPSLSDTLLKDVCVCAPAHVCVRTLHFLTRVTARIGYTAHIGTVARATVVVRHSTVICHGHLCCLVTQVCDWGTCWCHCLCLPRTFANYLLISPSRWSFRLRLISPCTHRGHIH